MDGLDPASENDFARSLHGVRKSVILRRIDRWRVEDNVIDDQTSALLRQALEEGHMQAAIPDVIQWLLQLLGRFFIQVDKDDFVRVQGSSPDNRQIETRPR